MEFDDIITNCKTLHLKEEETDFIIIFIYAKVSVLTPSLRNYEQLIFQNSESILKKIGWKKQLLSFLEK